MGREYFVYILSNRKNGAIYVGVTNDLVKRVYEHKNNLGSKFVTRYNIKLLVYYESFNNIDDAISAEKRIKKWRRVWKDELIESINPDWKDLSLEF